MDIKQFIFGKQEMPAWFTQQCRYGKAKITYGEDGKQISGAKIFTPSGLTSVNIGDCVMLLRSGMHVIPKDKIKKNNVEENKKKYKQ